MSTETNRNSNCHVVSGVEKLKFQRKIDLVVKSHFVCLKNQISMRIIEGKPRTFMFPKIHENIFRHTCLDKWINSCMCVWVRNSHYVAFFSFTLFSNLFTHKIKFFSQRMWNNWKFQLNEKLHLAAASQENLQTFLWKIPSQIASLKFPITRLHKLDSLLGVVTLPFRCLIVASCSKYCHMVLNENENNLDLDFTFLSLIA